MTKEASAAPVDLDELTAIAEACPDDTGMGYCVRCAYSAGQCICAERYALRYATKKPAVLALIAELRAHREREASGVTVQTKILELDASHEDMLLRVALEAPGYEIGRQLAPFLFEEVVLTVSPLPAPPATKEPTP